MENQRRKKFGRRMAGKNLQQAEKMIDRLTKIYEKLEAKESDLKLAILSQKEGHPLKWEYFEGSPVPLEQELKKATADKKKVLKDIKALAKLLGWEI